MTTKPLTEPVVIRNGDEQPIQPFAAGSPPPVPPLGGATVQEAPSEAVRKSRFTPLKGIYTSLQHIWLNLEIHVKIGRMENGQKEYYWILLTRRPFRSPESLSEVLKTSGINDPIISQQITDCNKQLKWLHKCYIALAAFWWMLFSIGFIYLFCKSFSLSPLSKISTIFTVISHIFILAVIVLLIIPLLTHKHTNNIIILKGILVVFGSLIIASLLEGTLLVDSKYIFQVFSINSKSLIEFLQISLILPGFTCIAIISFLCLALVIRWLEMRLYPIAIVTHNLVKILALLQEQSHDDWREIEHKHELLSRLETVARCIEYYLPRQLSSNDIILDAWLTQTTKQIALALREKKSWILTPKPDTHDHLVTSIAATLVHLVTKNWDALEKMEPTKLLPSEQLSHAQLRCSRWMRFLKTLSVAVLPLLAFVILQLTPWHIPDPSISSYVIIGLFAWGLLTLISVLDPTFNTKIAALKDLGGIWPFGKI